MSLSSCSLLRQHRLRLLLLQLGGDAILHLLEGGRRGGFTSVTWATAKPRASGIDAGAALAFMPKTASANCGEAPMPGSESLRVM